MVAALGRLRTTGLCTKHYKEWNFRIWDNRQLTLWVTKKTQDSAWYGGKLLLVITTQGRQVKSEFKTSSTPLIAVAARQRQAILWVWDRPGIQSEFQDSQNYTETLFWGLKKKTKKTRNCQKIIFKKVLKVHKQLTLGEKRHFYCTKLKCTNPHFNCNTMHQFLILSRDFFF